MQDTGGAGEALVEVDPVANDRLRHEDHSIQRDLLAEEAPASDDGAAQVTTAADDAVFADDQRRLKVGAAGDVGIVLDPDAR